jgi:hypothetical protein
VLDRNEGIASAQRPLEFIQGRNLENLSEPTISGGILPGNLRYYQRARRALRDCPLGARFAASCATASLCVARK